MGKRKSPFFGLSSKKGLYFYLRVSKCRPLLQRSTTVLAAATDDILKEQLGIWAASPFSGPVFEAQKLTPFLISCCNSLYKSTFLLLLPTSFLRGSSPILRGLSRQQNLVKIPDTTSAIFCPFHFGGVSSSRPLFFRKICESWLVMYNVLFRSSDFGLTSLFIYKKNTLGHLLGKNKKILLNLRSRILEPSTLYYKLLRPCIRWFHSPCIYFGATQFIAEFIACIVSSSLPRSTVQPASWDSIVSCRIHSTSFATDLYGALTWFSTIVFAADRQIVSSLGEAPKRVEGLHSARTHVTDLKVVYGPYLNLRAQYLQAGPAR